MFKLTSKKEGFTLIESLLAIGVLIVGILSAFVLVIRSLSNVPLIQSRLISANLAQEGIELVRQKRDSKSLLTTACICKNDGTLSGDCSSYEIDANDRVLQQIYGDADYLKLDPITGKYGYSTGDNGPYYLQRKIEICFPEQNYAGINPKEMRVKVFMD